jgi:hypothetical protein
MFNKGSCRNCGNLLTPMSMCINCREHVSWMCEGCGKADDAIHIHSNGFKYPRLDEHSNILTVDSFIARLLSA